MHRGFTLIETVIVLTLLAILALLALPAMETALVDARLGAAAQDVAAALRFARQHALQTGRPCRVVFDPAAESLSVESLEADFDPSGDEVAQADVETENWTTAPHGLRPDDLYALSFGPGEPSEGVDLVSADFGGNAVARFGARGEPEAASQAVVALAGRRITIDLSAPSGRVAVSD